MSDPFLLDHDGLRSLADDPIVRRGLAYQKQHRVVDIGWDERRLWATVAGSEPYSVEIEHDGEDLLFDCNCPFEWGPCCKHVVATLVAYADQLGPAEPWAGDAAAEATDARIRRGRTEVSVTRVEGDAWPSRWQARTLDAPSSRPPYEVEIRSCDERINHCTCPDFAGNRLGTCKHIEAVLHRLAKGGAGNRRIRLDRPTVFVDWRRLRPAVRLATGGDPSPAVRRWLEGHFDPDGVLRGELPEAVFALEAELADRDTVYLGADVLRLAREAAADDARARRGSRLTAAIHATGGRLPGIRATLYPYQVEGVAFLVSTERAVLADDMGLGKTLQAIAASAWLVDEGRAERVLVVCPASLKHQWAREIERFSGKSVQVVGGDARARAVQYRRRATYTIVNYELVTRDLSVLRASPYDVLVVDEAQRIKNWRTKTAEAVKALPSRYAFVLTGTPLENRLEDLYSLMQLVDPRMLGPLWQFTAQFHVTDERGRVEGYRNLTELRRRLRPGLLRRDRSIVRDQLPDRIETLIELPLDERQQELHDAAMRSAASLAAIRTRRPLTPVEETQLLSALQTARMACDAAGLVDGETESSPKLEELRRLLEEQCVEAGRKVVVFSQWKRMTDLAERVARDLDIGCAHLHGGVPTASRGALTDAFRDDPGTQVFLSTDAGGVGLNLQAATVLVNLDLPWNPAVLEQRIARVHRLGQRETTHIVLLVASPAYESRVGSLLAGKQALFDNVVAEKDDADAVGITRRALDVALRALDAGDGAAEDEAPASDPAPSAGPRAPTPTREETALSPLVASVERLLAPRVERMLLANGSLLVVATDLTPEDRRAVAALPADCPVALVDPETFAALSHFAGGLDGEPVVAPATHPTRSAASRKLEAAEALVERGCISEAFTLLVDAMLHAIAAALDTTPPPVAEAAAWVLTSAADPGDAHALLRAQALATAPRVPDALVSTTLDDARRLVAAGAGARSP